MPSRGLTAILLRSTRMCPNTCHKMCHEMCPKMCPEEPPEYCAQKVFLETCDKNISGTLFGRFFGTHFETPCVAHCGAHVGAHPCRPQQISGYTSAGHEEIKLRSIYKRQKRSKLSKKVAEVQSGSLFLAKKEWHY